MFDRIKEFINKHKRLLLIIAGILLVLVIAFLSIPRGKKTETPEEKTALPGAEIVQETMGLQKAELTAEDKAAANVFVSAKNFAEIYGSYSNQSNYANLEAVLPLLSPAYKAELEASLENLRASYKPGAFYEGVTTAVISSAVESLDDAAGTAALVLKTQRKISKGSLSDYTVEYKDIRVELQKIGDSWLVSGAKWLE